jgi:ABC-type methionine transport system ATPase subunit
VLASRPRVLICDECLCSLDIDRQSSMLKLLQRLQLKFGLAIVFLTVDLTSFSLMCANEAAFMKNGRFIEGGQAHDMVERPQRKDTLVYITQCTENEDRSHGKNLRNAFQKGKSVFSL